jgi:death-on-curing protein
MLVVLPSEEFIKDVHDLIVENYGGRSGILHPSVLSLAVDRPKHYIYYEHCNFHTVCAVILHTIARKHPFVDGNKRTALVVTIATYKLNKIGLDYSQADQEEFVDLMLWVVEHKPTIEEIAKKLTHLTNKYALKGAQRALQKAEYNFEI